jgi:hypothetical protein
MHRILVCLLICLPLCLLLAPASAPKLGFDAEKTKPRIAADPADHSLAIGFAAGSWSAPILYPLPSDSKMEELAKTDPISFFRQCLRRYDREVTSYTATLDKTERLNGKLHALEELNISFREHPFSALLVWTKNAGLAKKSLFVKGQNNDKLLILPNGRILSALAGVVERDADGPEARQSGRYPQSEFGIKIGTERTVASWEAAKTSDSLHITYLGQKKVPENGDRICYVFKRAPYDKPEEDGITQATFYVDKATWLQVGSVLRGEEGLIGEYWFRDIKLNPDFKPETFTRKGLTR